MRQRNALLAIAVITLPLASCTQYGAWNSQGMWQPIGSNSANLRAMIANPQDIVSGRGSVTAPGGEAARAVTNFETGRTPSLASTSVGYGGANGYGSNAGTGSMSSADSGMGSSSMGSTP